MAMAHIGDMQMYYEVRGSGPPLLFMGGTGWDLRCAPHVFDMAIAGRYTILAYDQRGQGRSGKPDVEYTMADYADDAAALLDAVGWQRCHVMGVSFGGMVAQEFALRHPQRVARLVLACSTSGGAGGASYPLHDIVHLPREEYARLTCLAADTRRDAAWQAGSRAQFEQMVAQSASRLATGADAPDHAIGLRRQLQARAGHDTYARLPELSMPVFVCGGRYDGVAPPERVDALHQRIGGGARFELFEGGHQFYQQDARAFEQIGSFLDGAG